MSRQATPDVLMPRERASATAGGASAHAKLPASRNAGSSARVRAHSLVEQQTRFFAAITTPDADAPYFDDPSAAELVTPSATLTAQERLEIYRTGYHARLVECLSDDYPALQHALGEAEFEALCRGYVAWHPSRGPSLNFYGAKLAQFCRTWQLQPAAFYVELASLEWAIVETIHAASGQVLQPSDLASVPPEAWPEVGLVVNPSLRMIEGAYPVNTYFQAYREQRGPSIPAPSGSVVAVYRTGRSVWRLPLKPAMANLLRLLAAGKPLAEATTVVSAQLADVSETEAANLVTRWFSLAVSSGLFSGLVLPLKLADAE